jgi:hypothetical protein
VPRQEPALVVDWQRPARRRPQASLETYSPDLVLAAARRVRAESRRRARAPSGRQLALDSDEPAFDRQVVELDLKAASRLKSIYISPAGPARPAHRPDDEIRDALVAACESGASHDEAVFVAARVCAIPLSALPLVEGLLDDLVLEGSVAAYGEALFSRRKSGRKVVAVDVGEDDLIELLSKGHRVLELK